MTDEERAEELGRAYEDLESIEAELARRDLHTFIEKTWYLVEPDRPFVTNWHIRVACKILEALDEDTLAHWDGTAARRVILNIPPGTMKSLVLVFWKAWCWARRPGRRFAKFSYGSHLSIRDNLRLREIVQSEWYKKHYGVSFVDDQNQKIRFNTTGGGWCFASSVNGVGTGEHPDVIEIDDPISADQARSDAEREAANTWFDRTISSRGITRDVVIIIVMQRLHEEDLTGHVLARGGKWFHFCIPMRYEQCTCTTVKLQHPEQTRTLKCKYHAQNEGWNPDPLDPRTEEGELLWPQLFTEEKVRTLEIDLGPYGTAGQLQQRPGPEGGGLFKREWFKFIDAAPRLARRCRGWDTAATDENPKQRGDYSAGVRVAEAAGRIFVEDVVHQRVGPAGLEALMMQTAESDGISVAIRELREPGGSGKAVIIANAIKFNRFDYAERLVGSDKVTQARPFRAQCEAGNVYVLRTGDPAKDAWIEPWIRELCDFPTGKFDDQVDGTSCAYNEVLQMPMPTLYAPTGIGGERSYWDGPQ